jgi:alpha-galactosidase
MRFHRLFVLAPYGSLAIVLIAVLCPTAKGQSQHLASTPPMGWNSWNHFSDKVTDSDVRAAADYRRQRNARCRAHLR